MARIAPFHCALLLGSLVLLARPAAAVQPSETLLPDTTKGYVAAPDIELLRSRFKETQLGALVQDAAMKDFIEDLRGQIRGKLNSAGARLGLTWEDLEGVPAGEVAIAAIQPDAKDKNSHATAILVDITGKRAEADALLAKMDKNLLAQRAVKGRDKAGAIDLTLYTLPAREIEKLVGTKRVMVKVIDIVVHFIHEDELVVTNHKGIAADIAGRFGKEAKDTLAKLPAYQHVMARLAKDQGNLTPQARWFLEPFGYTEVSRAMAGGKKRRGMDILTVLRKQGFTAIEGLGGHVFFATGEEEMLHRTFVFAPPGWELAMRMLAFPNSDRLAPPDWVSRDVATYVTFHNTLQNSFWYSETLVDEYMGDKGVFKDMIDNLRIDPAGPMIDIKKELVDHLGERVVVVSDVAVPVTTKSERLIVAIEITNPAIVAKTLQKNFAADPKAKKRLIGEHIIWEVMNEETADPELTIEGDDGGFVAAQAKDEEEEAAEKPILPNMAFTVFQGQLMVATHVEFLEEVMNNAGKSQPLAKLAAFEQVDKALTRLGAGQDALRSFTRTDESYRGTYDLVRQGKLPQGETILARILNNAMGSGKKDEFRKQEIDGTKLPPFEQVQKYLGPAGAYLHTEENGWILVGCLLKKEAE